jgi:hypothetical protein
MSKTFRFYHVPKTGGTSIFMMTTKWKNHKRASRTNNHVRISTNPPLPGDIAYAVTRNPYDRFISAFYHLVDACKDEFYYKDAKVSDCDWLEKHNLNMKMFYNDPNEFLAALCDNKHPLYRDARRIFYQFSIFRPQMYWLGNSRGTSLHHSLTMLLSHENLEEQFEKHVATPLQQTVDWSKNLNKRLTTKEIPLSDESKVVIQKLYPDDFEAMGYKM